MPKSRVLTGALVTAAFVVASLFAAAPASAATLPSGQKITVVDTNDWQFYDSSTTAVLTPVGTATELGEDEFVEAIDVDDDGFGYGLTTIWGLEEPVIPDDCEPEDERPECNPFPISVPLGAKVYEADANTGLLTGGVTIEIATGPLDEPIWVEASACKALDYSGGILIAACSILGDEGDSEWVGTLDPDTGELYPSVLLVDEDFVDFDAIALDPVYGDLWGFDGDEAYIIYLGSGDVQEVGSVDFPISGADFDRDGQLWLTATNPPAPPAVIEPGQSGLVTLNLDNGNFELEDAWSDQQAVINAITVWGKPLLPATGPADQSVPVIAAGLLLLGGAILAGVTVLRRRNAEA